MGVLYTVSTLTSEVRGWVSNFGVEVAIESSSRGAVLSEICEVLDSLQGYSIDYTKNGVGSSWQAMITSSVDSESGMWTLMNITRLAPLSDPQNIWFEKGSPELIVAIVSAISKRCGALVLIPDTGCAPLVVRPKDDPAQLCAQWEHLHSKKG